MDRDVGQGDAIHPRVVMWAVEAGLLALLISGRLWWLPVHVPLDVNEGWNAFHALDVLRGGPLYPEAAALTGNNYPPLSFYIVAMVGALTGDVIIAGRIVSLVAMLGIGGLVAMAIRRLKPDASWAAPLGAFLFLGFAATRFRRYAAINDPQWLGQALMMSAILVLLWPAERRLSLGRIVVASALTIAGGFIKHNLVAFPIAATLWLLMVDRRSLIQWIVSAAMIGIAAGGLCLWAFGPNIVTAIFGAAREYSYARMVSKSAGVIPLMLPMVYVSSYLFRTRSLDRRVDLVILLVLVSLPIGILQRSGEGVDVNAHFDALIALSLAAPIALVDRLDQGAQSKVLFGLLFAPILILAPSAASASVRELRERDVAAATIAPLIKRIADVPGRVACEDQALCYWSGKGFELDFFLIDQRLRAGKGAMAFHQAMKRRWLAAAVVSKEAAQDGQNPVVAAFRAHYRLTDARGQYWVFRPR